MRRYRTRSARTAPSAPRTSKEEPPRLGATKPLGNAALFALYHLQTPWLTLTRILAITPLAYIASRTRDVRIGMVAHVVLNAVDLAVLTLFVIR